jgi:ribosomal protein S6--L-glutamate ligase
MRFLVLSRNQNLYSTSRIVLAARARGHDVTVIDPLDLQIVVSKGRPALLHEGNPVPRVDLVIPRIGASITNYGLAVVRQFDLMGVPVLNSAVSISRSRDKLRALQLLSRKHIEVPTTICARSPAGVESALALVGCPAIVKLQQGTQGIGTMIAETPQAVHSLLETLWAMGQDIVLQEYVRESKGRDVRVFVVGGRVVASMRRVAKKGEFRSNLHRGGKGDAVTKLPPVYRNAAIRAVKVMGLEVAGVDMLESKKKPKILEINSSPGLEGIERASGVDVAGAIIEHAEKYAATHGRISQREVDQRISSVIYDERMPPRASGGRPNARMNGRANGRARGATS